MIHLRDAATIVFLCCGAARAQAPAASGPAEASWTWGESKAGLQLAARVEGETRAGGRLVVRAALRNVGEQPVALPPRGEVRAWLMVVYSRDKAFLTALALPARELKSWPAELPGGQAIELPPFDAAALGCYDYADRRKLLSAYLSGDVSALDKPPQTLSEALSAGQARARLTVCLPRAGGPLAVSSAALELDVAPPELDKLAPAARKAFVADLLERFGDDAFAAKAGHALAVKVGTPVVPDLVRAVNEPARHAFGRMWLATALADIRDARAAEALTKLLDDRERGVAHVVAYHGPKQRSDVLDRAILSRAAAGSDTAFAAYALLGFMVHRGQVPAELLAGTIDSPDPRVQAAVRGAMKHYAGDTVVARLRKLAESDDPRLSPAARKVLAAMNAAQEP
ncbi:MAG TPA: hypothetical protein PK082_08775 [Phycisphaerae bacterium]|nr:hypothetical protein [Phycisphaerae bacterium]